MDATVTTGNFFDAPFGAILALIDAQSIIALGVAVTAGVAAFQLWQNSRITKARIVADFLKIYFADKDMQDMAYAIEYEEFKYDDNFHGSADERKLDKLLGHFNGLAHFWKKGILAHDDLLIIDYELCCIMRNREVKAYLGFVMDFAQRKDRDFLFRFLVECWDERKKRKLPSYPVGKNRYK